MRGARARSGPSRCTPSHGHGLSPHGQYSPSCGTRHRWAAPRAPRRRLPGTSTPGRPARTSPSADPKAVSEWRPRRRGSASRQPSSDTSTKLGVPLPADRYGPACPARPRMELGPGGGTTAAGTPDPTTLVLAHGYPGPCQPSRKRGPPAAPAPWRSPIPQPAGGSGLGLVARERTPGPVLPPGARAGTASRPRHGNLGMGGDRARYRVQMDNSCCPATHAVATGFRSVPG